MPSRQAERDALYGAEAFYPSVGKDRSHEYKRYPGPMRITHDDLTPEFQSIMPPERDDVDQVLDELLQLCAKIIVLKTGQSYADAARTRRRARELLEQFRRGQSPSTQTSSEPEPVPLIRLGQGDFKRDINLDH